MRNSPASDVGSNICQKKVNVFLKVHGYCRLNQPKIKSFFCFLFLEDIIQL